MSDETRSPNHGVSGKMPGPRFRTSPFSVVAHALLLAGASVAVFLAGKPQEGASGIFLVCAGLAMITCKPRIRVEGRLWAIAGATLGCAALALLPESFLAQPRWRQALDSTPWIFTPATISVAPGLTGFWLALLGFSLLTGLFALTQPLRTRWLLFLVAAAAAAAAIYAGLAIYVKKTGWSYPFVSETATFGFFPNRNHTATLLFVGCLLAIGILGTVLRGGRWLIGLLAAVILTVCASGLVFFSPSRGGIVFLVVGVFLWIAGLGKRHRDVRVTVSFAALIVAAALLFVLSGGEVRDRLLGTAKPAPAAAGQAVWTSVSTANAEEAMHNITADFRLKIYRDAFAQIRDYPVTGIGLGTFASVFPQYRHDSLSEATAIHPESDWLMFTAEAGVPAMLCLLALLALLLKRINPERMHSHWPLRWGCAVAAGAAALHGLVDVPLHRAPLGWWVLVVGGLALQSFRAGGEGYSRVQHAAFIAGGIGTLTLGAALVRAQWFDGPPLPPFAYAAAHDRFFHVVQHNRDGALVLAQQFTREFPMENEAFLNLGQTFQLYFESERFVDKAFKAQRLLEPCRTATALIQAASWLRDDPQRAATLWVDALERFTRINRAAGQSDKTAEFAFFGEVIRRAAGVPEAQERLWKVAEREPGFTFAWVENSTPLLAREAVGRLSADAGFLHRLSLLEQRRFLRDWYMRGDKTALDAFLESRADWRDVGWPARLRRFVDTQQFERAVREGAAHYLISLALPEPGKTSGGPLSPDAQEIEDPAGAFAAYWATGNTRSAQRVLDEAVGQAKPSQASELWRLKAAVAARTGDWPGAWNHLQQAINLQDPNFTF